MTSASTQQGDAQLYTPLGLHRNSCYFRTSQGLLVWFSPTQLVREGPALMLVPDMEHWQALYPSRNGGGVNWRAIGAALIRQAQACGEYEPPAGYGPVNGSRLPYSPSERLAAYRLRQESRKVSTMVARAQRQAQRETPAG